MPLPLIPIIIGVLVLLLVFMSWGLLLRFFDFLWALLTLPLGVIILIAVIIAVIYWRKPLSKFLKKLIKGGK